MISVTLIGSGNVASHLFKAFNKSNKVVVNEWFSRNTDAILEYEKQTIITDDLSQLQNSDIYILAISDDALSKVSDQLPFENRLIVHTSGSVNMKDLNKKNRRGVFYPLQTFSKDTAVDFNTIPLCIEAVNKKDLAILESLAIAIGSPCCKIDTEQRQTLHISAVFINNFVNQLYRIAHEISDDKNIEFEMLKPLIMETANKVQNISPYRAQTGPAIRRDKKTIKRHLRLLEKDEHKAIYELLTKSIQNTHGISRTSTTKKQN